MNRRCVPGWMAPALAAVMALAGCGGSGGSAEGAGKEAPAVKVRLVEAVARDVPVRTEVTGQVVAPRHARIAAELAARVVRVRVDVGDVVKKGEVLVLLDDTDARARLAAAESDAARLEAELASQQRLVARYRELQSKKFVTPTLMDQAESRAKALEKALEAARANARLARQMLARTRVRAPFAGRVQARFVAEGDFIGVGKPLVSLVASGRRQVLLPFPETMRGRIRPGQPVRLALSGASNGSPGWVEARIDEVQPAVDAASAAFRARVNLPPELDWPAGASVRAQVELARHQNAVVVPTEAVVLRPRGPVVYRIENGIAREVAVRTGAHLDGMIEILSGIKAGDRVAGAGAAYLSNGARVEIVEAQTAEARG